MKNKIPMWKYSSPIGNMYIIQQRNGKFGLLYEDTIWDEGITPQAIADDVFCYSTSCYEWDSLNGRILDVPPDLSAWEYLPHTP